MKSLSHILHTALLLFAIVGITVAAGENCYQEVPLPEEWYFPQNPTQANSLKKVQFSKQERISDILEMLKAILRYQECETLSSYGKQLHESIIKYYNNTTANNIFKLYDELDKQIADLKNESDANKKTTLVRSFINAIPLFQRENKKDIKELIKLTELPQATGAIPLGYNAESIINAQAAKSESLTALNTYLENFGTDNSYSYFSNIFPTLIFSTNKLGNNSQIILQQEYEYLENAMVDLEKFFAQNINEKILFIIGKKLLQNITKDARKKPLTPQIKAVIIHLICWFAIKSISKQTLLTLLQNNNKNPDTSVEKIFVDLLYHDRESAMITQHLKYLISKYYPEEKKYDWLSYPTIDQTLLLQLLSKESSKEQLIKALFILKEELLALITKKEILSIEIEKRKKLEKTYNEITSNQRLITLLNHKKNQSTDVAILLLTPDQKKLEKPAKDRLLQEKSNLITSYLKEKDKASIRPIAELEKNSQEINVSIVAKYNAILNKAKNKNEIPIQFWLNKSEITVATADIDEIKDFINKFSNYCSQETREKLQKQREEIQDKLFSKESFNPAEQTLENCSRKKSKQKIVELIANTQNLFRKNSTQQNAQKIEFLQQLFKKKMKYADTQKAINAMTFYDRCKHKFLRWIEQPQAYLSLLGGGAVATTGFIYWLHTNKQKSHPTFAIPKKKTTPKPVLQILKKTNASGL